MNSDSPRRFEIRQAGPEQFDELLLLVSEFHQVAHLPFSPSGTGAALRRLLESRDLGFALIGSEASAITGYILVVLGFSLEFGGRDAFVDELYVRPPFQKQGIGTALLLEAEKLAPKFAINALHLESDFHNHVATSLYESKGYQKHPRSLMTKWLHAPSDLRPTHPGEMTEP